jgi:lysine 2,3-aminomutase
MNSQIANTVQGDVKLFRFLNAVLPANIPIDETGSETQTRDEFIGDVFDGVKASTMAIRITPYILSRINWQDPRHDPVFRQFIHLKSAMIPDHPKGELDSLHEEADSPAKGLVHRYPDKALFLGMCFTPHLSQAVADNPQQRLFAQSIARTAPALARLAQTHEQ